MNEAIESKTAEDYIRSINPMSLSQYSVIKNFLETRDAEQVCFNNPDILIIADKEIQQIQNIMKRWVIMNKDSINDGSYCQKKLRNDVLFFNTSLKNIQKHITNARG